MLDSDELANFIEQNKKSDLYKNRINLTVLKGIEEEVNKELPKDKQR